MPEYKVDLAADCWDGRHMEHSATVIAEDSGDAIEEVLESGSLELREELGGDEPTAKLRKVVLSVERLHRPRIVIGKRT